MCGNFKASNPGFLLWILPCGSGGKSVRKPGSISLMIRSQCDVISVLDTMVTIYHRIRFCCCVSWGTRQARRHTELPVSSWCHCITCKAFLSMATRQNAGLKVFRKEVQLHSIMSFHYVVFVIIVHKGAAIMSYYCSSYINHLLFVFLQIVNRPHSAQLIPPAKVLLWALQQWSLPSLHFSLESWLELSSSTASASIDPRDPNLSHLPTNSSRQ